MKRSFKWRCLGRSPIIVPSSFALKSSIGRLDLSGSKIVGSFIRIFLELAQSWWSQEVVGGYAGYRMSKKRRALKDDIKRWNRVVFGRMDKSREALSKIVEDLDKESESWDLRLEEV